MCLSGIIPLDCVSVRAVTEEKDKERPWQLEIYNESPTTQQDRERMVVKGCKLDKTGAVVMGNHKVYRMAAASRWLWAGWSCSLKKLL